MPQPSGMLSLFCWRGLLSSSMEVSSRQPGGLSEGLGLSLPIQAPAKQSLKVKSCCLFPKEAGCKAEKMHRNELTSLFPMNELMPALLVAFLKYHYSRNLKGSGQVLALLPSWSFPFFQTSFRPPLQTWGSIKAFKVSGMHLKIKQRGWWVDANSPFRKSVTTLPDSESCSGFAGFAWHLHKA